MALCRVRLAHSGADAMLRALQEQLPALQASSTPPAAMERLWAVLQAGVAVGGTLISDADLSTMRQDWQVRPGVPALCYEHDLLLCMRLPCGGARRASACDQGVLLLLVLLLANGSHKAVCMS